MTHYSPVTLKTVPTLPELKARYQHLKALFFDMDGTLFNTETHHAQAFWKIGIDYQVKPPLSPQEIHALLVGKADYLVFDIVREWDGFPQHWTAEEFVNIKNHNLLEILSRTDPATYFDPAIQRLLKEARSQGLILALVTSSEKVITKKLLELAGLKNFFDFELTRDDCPLHKPDPWPYLHALRETKLVPHEVIIFEDSPVGLAAALGTGSHVVKVEWY